MFCRHVCRLFQHYWVKHQLNIHFTSLNSFFFYSMSTKRTTFGWTTPMWSLTCSSSEPAVGPTVNLDWYTLSARHSSESVWKTDTQTHVDWQSVGRCVRDVLAVSPTHMTVTWSQLGLFGDTSRSLTWPLTPSCVSGHRHLPGTNEPSDSLTAQTGLEVNSTDGATWASD